MGRQLVWVILGLVLSGCQGSASEVKRAPQDINASPRSMDDRALRDLQKGGSRSE